MKRSMLWLAPIIIGGLGGLLLSGCGKPCDTTNQCGDGQVCAGALCQQLTCDTAMFATDPKSGACVALSGCFLTADQRGWKTCSADPCQGLGESACLQDARCQPAYENPDVVPSTGSGNGIDVPAIACGVAVGDPPSSGPGPNGIIASPGVNNGDAPKHPPTTTFSCFPNNTRSFVACRAVPQIAPQPDCGTLSAAACTSRFDCTTDPAKIDPTTGQGGGTVFNGGPAPTPVAQPGVIGPDGTPAAPAVCFSRFPRVTDCASADALSCLTNPACQVIGGKGFCPPNASCGRSGDFLSCEPNDRLRRCHTSADCNGGERCDNDEACIAPRTFENAQDATTGVPGTGGCLGACVPTGCAGFGENFCSDHPECDGGTFATVCHPKPYCSGGKDDPNMPGPGPVPPGTPDPTNPVGTNCGCDSEFQGCSSLAQIDGLRPERSLLIRDPEIVSDPAFRIDTVITSLAPAGQADQFVQSWLAQFSQDKTLSTGATAQARKLFLQWLQGQQPSPSVAFLLSKFHTTSLANRLDLASATDCGEARITFALSDAYQNGNTRMTIIFEMRVPDDGAHCRTVAQRWAELSLMDDLGQRRAALQAIYKDLLSPAHLAQVRTNEFINLDGLQPWELREWHLNGQGFLDLAPVKQTVDPAKVKDPALMSWVQGNMAGIKAGTVIVPDQFLAASSRENGGRLALLGSTNDMGLKAAQDGLNQLSCSGCHLTETKSPFVHVGERLGKGGPNGYQPNGRSVIDAFLLKELGKRAKNMQSILTAPPVAQNILPPWRQLIQARVH